MKGETVNQIRWYQSLSIIERVQLVQNCRDVSLLLDYWNFEYTSDLPSEMVNQAILEQIRRLTQ
ncbi:MAG: hypothetical protein RMK49_00800 [Abditibacteriales bacterium]|nr:hypothetical protein [Abditibacteriales bacterium]